MDLGQLFVHLKYELAITGMALRAGTNLMQVEGLTGVVGDFPAHLVAKQGGVLSFQTITGLLQETVELKTGIETSFELIAQAGLFDKPGDFIAIPWRQRLPG